MNNYPIAVNEKEATLVINGPATIAQAKFIRQAILEAISLAPTLHLDCSQVSRVDLTFLQILQATDCEVRRQQKTLRVVEPDLPLTLRQAIFRGGFEERASAPHDTPCPFFQRRHLGETPQ